MDDLKKWMPAALAVACLLVWSAGSAWAKDDVRPGSTRAHITVNDTVHGVLSSHRSLMSIKENRSALEHEVSKAQAGFGPRVDVSGSIGVGVLSDTTSRGLDVDDQWLSVGSVSAKLVQPIWDGFATRSRVRTAQATLDSVKARVFDTATSLSLDGIIAHIDLLRRVKLLELARTNVARHEAILGQARDRASMGADTQADVTQAESRLQRARSSLAEAEDALRVAYATYSRLTGIYTVGQLDAVPMPPDMPDTVAAFIETAEKHNPKLAAFLQDIRAQSSSSPPIEMRLQRRLVARARYSAAGFFFSGLGASMMVPSGSTMERACTGQASMQAVIFLPFSSRHALHMSQRTATSRRLRWAMVSPPSSGMPMVSSEMVP